MIRPTTALAIGTLLTWLPACTTPPTEPTVAFLVSQSQSSPYDVTTHSDAVRKGKYRMSANANGYLFTGGDFTLGSVKDPWDSAQRWEGDFIFHMRVQEHVEPFANGYIFWEDREWSQGASDINYNALGFGIGTGAFLYALKGSEDRAFNLSLKPWARFGIAFNDGTFNNVRSSKGFATGNIGGERLEIGLGADLVAILFRRIYGGVGVGVDWWSSSNVDAVTRDSIGGSIVDPDDSLSFRGNDVFARFTVGIKF